MSLLVHNHLILFPPLSFNRPYEDEVEYIILDVTRYSKIFDLLKEKKLVSNLQATTFSPRFVHLCDAFPYSIHILFQFLALMSLQELSNLCS